MRNRMVLLQTVVIVVAWLVPAALHAGNDGLWFQGDAARHALNGLFWWDLLTTLPLDPRQFVLRYYARYPAITPTSYPPFFYLLEGLAYRLFGASPFVAEWLVLGCSLVTCLYVAAWLRRYVACEAGWGGALLALQPGVVLWSNAVMLNVPSMALGMMALYYTRRWLEAPSPGRMLGAGALGLLVTLTYFPAALVVLAMGAWILSEGHWRPLWNRHRGALLVGVGVLGVLGVLVLRFVPLPLALAFPGLKHLTNSEAWLRYVWAVPKILNPSILVLAALAFPAAVIAPAARRDLRLLTIWLVITYVGLSCLWSQDPRYALLVAPAFVILAMMGLRGVLRMAGSVVGIREGRCFSATLAGLVVVNAAVAWVVPVPRITGFRELADLVVRDASTERILYDGRYDGVFTFYLRAQDPAFEHGVVRGSKMFYSTAISPMWHLTERVRSVAEVLTGLEKECGCGWLLIEQPGPVDEVAGARYVREAVRGSQFRLVTSLPVDTPETSHVDVYQFLGPLSIPEDLELEFPLLGDKTHWRVRPIERRAP